MRSNLQAVCFIVLALSGIITPSRAQATQASQAPAPAIRRGELNDMLYSLQLDELINRASNNLAATGISTHDLWVLHFYRGSAYWRLGLLDEAEADMKAIAPDDPDGAETRRTPRWYLSTIALQKAQRPAHRADYTTSGRLLFKIYYDNLDQTVRSLWELLPIAVNSVQRMTGSSPRETVILVFNSMQRMQAYEDIPQPTLPINGSVVAHGGLNGIHIAPLRLGERYTDPLSAYFRLTVTHEYTHVVIARLLETQNHLPIWLAEGLANVAGCLSAPGEEAHYARRFKVAADANAVIPYDEICSPRDFNQMSDEQFNGKRHEDPYAQATQMTRYLLLGRSPAIIARLLNTMHDDDNFNDAFRKTFGEMPEDFYREWREYAAH